MSGLSNRANTGRESRWLALLFAGLQSAGLLLVLVGVPKSPAPVLLTTEASAATITWEDVDSHATLAQYVAAFREQQSSTATPTYATPAWLRGAQLLFAQSLSESTASPASSANAMAAACVQVELPIEPTAKRAVFKLFGEFHQHPLKGLSWCFHGYWGEAKPASSSPTIRFTPTARAYAKASDIYLPATASVDLLAHELAHIAGLADEYAMRTELAAPFCQGRYRHPSLNVVVTQSKTLTAAELQQLWQRLPWRSEVADWRLLGTPERQSGKDYWRLGSAANTQVGLFAVATCAEVGKFAWRPVPQTTAMQHFDVPHWPPLYLELMQRYLSE